MEQVKWRPVWLKQVDSTNDEVKRRLAEGASEGLAVMAGEQTAGRGRKGNSYASPVGKGLYLSVLLRPNAPPETLAQLTAWTAAAVCRGIEACGGAKVGIKWVNDLILNGRKLGGILTELETAPGGPYVVIGVGVNTGQGAEDFEGELEGIATSLAMEGFDVTAEELASHILSALNEMYASFPEGKEAYLADYRARCVTTGREVFLMAGGAATPAFAQGVDDDFQLKVRLFDGTERAVAAGEVSVRGIMGRYM